MKKTLFKLSCAAFVLLSVSSCKKSSSPKSKTELLTQKAWILTNSEEGSGNNWTTEAEFAASEACEKDDEFVFKTDKTFEVTEGATKCEDSGSGSEQGTWNFEDNETKINWDSEIGTIDQLDEHTLILRGIEPNGSDINYRFTFKH
jgi:hypothetical protein